MKQKQTYRPREQTVVAKQARVVGEGWIESLRLAGANHCTQNGKTARSYWRAQETRFDIRNKP